MAIVIVTGETGCRTEELARDVARRLDFELLSGQRLGGLLREEFGALEVPDRAWPAAVTSILARLAAAHHLVVAVAGAELLFQNLPGILRVGLAARAAYRTGLIMVDRRVERKPAAAILREEQLADRRLRKARFGRVTPGRGAPDLVLNCESHTAEQAADLVIAAVRVRGLEADGLLSAAAESQIQFQVRMQLAAFGMTCAGKANIERKPFGHPSEQLFANLLDFYRIAWEYEPRSFPLEWDHDGRVTEAFTPDFFLPEFNMYVELTTMKQSLVTRKNRKVKRLRSLYPDINIQVFYQKDFQDLVSKHGLSDRVVMA